MRIEVELTRCTGGRRAACTARIARAVVEAASRGAAREQMPGAPGGLVQ